MQLTVDDSQIATFLNDFFRAIEGASEIVLLSHENMDPDAIGSIAGILDLIAGAVPRETSIGVYPPSVSKLSRRLIDTWGIEIPFIQDLPGSDFLPIMVDTQNAGTVFKGRAGGADAVQARSIIIDHHQAQGLPCRLGLISSDVQANCEIIVRFYQARGTQPRPPANRALLGGILFDSGSLRYARNSTITAVGALLDTGLNLDEFKGLMSESLDLSERIARLKAGIRCTINRPAGAIVASSEVSSYEASACRGLIGLGADVAIVLAENKGEVRISARQTAECHKAYHVNLASVMRSIAGIIGGTGGGHELAAAASGSKGGAAGLKEAIKTIEEIINASARPS